MTTAPKAPSKSSPKPRAKPAAPAVTAKPAAPARKPPAAKPKAKAEEPTQGSQAFLRVYHSSALRKQTLLVLGRLEQAADPTQHRADLANLVIDLTKAGMDYCFIQQLKQAKAGFLLQQSASLGMAGAVQVIGGVIRNIIGRMEAPQLLSVSDSIRRLGR